MTYSLTAAAALVIFAIITGCQVRSAWGKCTKHAKVTCPQSDSVAASVCLYNYIYESEEKRAESYSEYCRGVAARLEVLENCLSGYRDCGITTTPYGPYAVTFHDLVCSAKDDCSFLKLLSCYQPLLLQLGLTIPTDVASAPAFLDSLASAIHSNTDTLCRASSAVANQTECLLSSAAKLVTNCPAGPSGQRVDSDVMMMAVREIIPDSTKEQTQAICNEECSDFGNRWQVFKMCEREYLKNLRMHHENLDYFSDPGFHGKCCSGKICSAAGTYLACVASSVKGCPFLLHQLETDTWGLLEQCQNDVAAAVADAPNFLYVTSYMRQEELAVDRVQRDRIYIVGLGGTVLAVLLVVFYCRRIRRSSSEEQNIKPAI